METLNWLNSQVSKEYKLNMLFGDKEIAARVLNLKSSTDIYRFYRRIINEYIPNNGEIILYGGYSKNKKGGKKYTILVNLYENDNDKFWIWSNGKHRMVSVSQEYIKQFIDENRVQIVPGKKIKKNVNK